MKKNVLDVVIIGGGVAGATVGIYLARAGHKPMIITEGEIGGKLNDIELIQNYVGVHNASGMDVADDIFKQLKQSGLKSGEDIKMYTTVLSVDMYNENLWEILIQEDMNNTTEKIFAKNVVIATGMEKLKLPQIESSLQHNCVLCDGFMYKRQDVVVIGGGDSAFTEAIELAKICQKVTILSRSENLKAEKILIDRVNSSSNIEITYGEIESFEDGQITIVDSDKPISTDGLFTYIGSKPNSDFLPSYVKKDVHGHVVRKGNNAMFFDGVIDNMYIVGDITTTTAKQFGIAIGQATLTATELIEKL